MPTEIERKFLVDPAMLPVLNLDQYTGIKIDQGYLTPSVRVRQKGSKYFLTFKQATGNHAAERLELETEITKENFDTLWPGTEGRRVEKTRYEIPFDDLTIELDVYQGDNTGHAVAEVEFESTSAADAFQPPEWFGADVTADKAYTNASIAEHGFPKS